MTVGEFLDRTTRRLKTANIETAHLDALILLEDALQRDRATILAHPEAEIASLTEAGLNNKVVQRATNLPLAYIRGKTEFYGREFVVHEGVLVPRPETETMIELLKAAKFPPEFTPPHVADVGAGSGCLGITAVLELPGAQVALYDIDAAVLDLAALNAKNHKVHAEVFLENFLSQAVHRHYDIILANLPYVPTGHSINEAAGHEPRLAIFSGEDGLDAYRSFWDDVTRLEWQPAYILTEALSPQHKALTELAKNAGYHLAHAKGLVQQFTPAS